MSEVVKEFKNSVEKSISFYKEELKGVIYKRPKQNSVNHTRGEYKREHACEVARGEYFD